MLSNGTAMKASPSHIQVCSQFRLSPSSFLIKNSLVKAQELEALADAVRSENYRLHALEAQARSARSQLI